MEEMPRFDGSILLEGVKKYRYALLVLLVGAVLMLLPTGKQEKSVLPAGGGATVSSSEEFDLTALEERLAASLSAIQGVGQAEVVLTLEAGSRRILAQDMESDGDRGRSSTVILSTGSGTEETVTMQLVSPVYQGALVVCDGGGDPGVRLEVLHAVEALTGLRADRIAISQRRQSVSSGGG